MSVSASKPARQCNPIERLEWRALLTTYTFTGTPNGESFLVWRDPGNASQILVNIDGTSYPIANPTAGDSIVIDALGGNDRITVEYSGDVAITANGDAGTDQFHIGGQDLDSNVRGSLVMNGGADSDSLTFNDQLDDAGDDTMGISTFGSTLTSVYTKGVRTYTSTVIEGFLTVNGSQQPTTYYVDDVGYNSSINAGGADDLFRIGVAPGAVAVGEGRIRWSLQTYGNGGNDTFEFGGGDLDTLGSNIQAVGNAGTDSVILSDQSNVGPTEIYLLDQGSFGRSDGSVFSPVLFQFIERVTLNASDSANTILVRTHDYESIVNAGAGNDSIYSSDGTVTVRGGAGDDLIDATLSTGSVGKTTLDQSDTLSTLTIGAGSKLEIAAGGAATIVVGTISLLSGTLNLNDNALITKGNTESFVSTRMARGHNHGLWNGVPAGGIGVIVSGVAANSAAVDSLGYAKIGTGVGELNLGFFNNQPVLAGNVVISYTRPGDSDLDHDVDFNDLVALAQNYNELSKNMRQGDFDYDGDVDFNDLVALAQQYGLGVVASTIVVQPPVAAPKEPAGTVVDDASKPKPKVRK